MSKCSCDLALVVCLAAASLCGSRAFAVPGDSDADGDRDKTDLRTFVKCVEVGGPGATASADCVRTDFVADAVIDVRDFATFQNSYSPWVRIVSTSPGNGDNGVALTRETIINLSGVVDPETVSPDNLFAVFGGAKLGARLAPTPDGRRLKLFYQPTLPASARVRVTLDGSTILDEFGNQMDADGDGIPGGVTNIDFDTCSTGRIPKTVVWGYVIASEPKANCTPPPNEPPGVPGACDVPLQGVTIRVDGFAPSVGPCDLSNPSHVCAVTDANGRFWLGSVPPGPNCSPEQAFDPKSPCYVSNAPGVPVPAFFVHVDGSTTTAVGGQTPSSDCSYPSVGKPFHSVTGYPTQVNMAGVPFAIHLPCVSHDTMQSVDPDQETQICMSQTGQRKFKELLPDSDPSMLCITVPPNSLRFDDGTPGRALGMFPVDSTRLPAPLGGGVVHAFDITIQTDGATNFELPAPICFPNVADPSTHALPHPGAKLELVSFNHDNGKWEPRGPMTVVDDNNDGVGDRVCTDAGAGVVAPGWHGQVPGSGGSGGPPGDPGGCQEECCDDCCMPESPPIQELVYDAAKAAWECAKDLTKVKKGVRCLIDLATASIDLYRAAQQLAEELSEHGLASREAARAILKLLEAEKDKMTAALDCVREQSPIGRGEAIVNCISGILEYAAQLCEPIKEPPPGCDPPSVLRFVCRGIALAEGLLSETKALIDTAKAWQERAVVELACQAFDRVKQLIGGTAAAGSGGAFTPEEYAELVLRVEELQRYAQQSSEAEAFSRPWLASLFSLEADLTQRSEESFAAIDGTYSKGERTLFYVLDVGGNLFRGSTGGNGRVERIVTGEVDYFLAVYDPSTHTYAHVNGITKPSGTPTRFFGLLLQDAAGPPDEDQDGLSDDVEFVFGTDQGGPDSDGDGVTDGAEVEQGTDPLDGRPTVTGVIATSDTPGTAVDICAINDVALLADSDRGVTVFNVTNGQAPVAIAQVDTPGTALAVSCSGNLIAVADGAEGLQIVDITDPPAARIVRQIPSRDLGGGSAQAVATVGDLAFVGTARSGTSGGRVSMVELPTGIVLQRFDLGGTVQDLAVEGSTVYAFANGRLHAMPLIQGFFLQTAGSVAVPGNINSSHGRGRLFVGGGIAYVVVTNGYHTFNVSNPNAPQLIAPASTGQAGWKGIALNGSGLGIAAVGPNPSPNATTDEVYLFNTGNPAQTNQFVTLFPTPGITRAVSLYNGLAYVADHGSGMQVVNYLAYDALGLPPTGTMTTSAQGGTLSEGERVFFRANVGDDVQVRNVEFFVNGARAVLDGNFPFEFAFRAPPGSRGQTFSVTGTARDTGGNTLNLGPIVLTAVADDQPPIIEIQQPVDGTTFFRRDVVKVRLQATDNVAVASISFRIDGVPIALRRLALDEWELNPPDALGVHELIASATDTAGNTGTSEPVRFFVRDQATSRLFTVFNDGVNPSPPTDVISRLFTVFHSGSPAVEFKDVVSRVFTVFHDLVNPVPMKDVASRLFTVFSPPQAECSLIVPQDYFENFEDGADSVWSSGTTDSTAANQFTRFSGRFSNNAQTLRLETAPGLGAVLTFDLYIIDTWDGQCGGAAGPDYFAVTVDGRTAFHHTFVSNPPSNCQSYGPLPSIGPAALGFGGTNDSIYRGVSLPITTLDDRLDIAFIGLNLQGGNDETWGVDNVRIEYVDTNGNNIPDACE